MSNELKTLVVIAFLILILWNLGAGLYYMIVDKGRTKRTVRSLTWRIGLSVALILLVILGIATGLVQPHGIGR
ncbi:twin transmembrane helix small protein [Arenimonas fontis]|uniref:Twin transmembrane helix small protein n=1 Tax=Arenimonas fontis TaxID=2608255 RepID=A0A5B2Z8Y0_9GAMM|nr:twin transmembrane helix small protein [Arenimonas fontis]KAA2283983.1 twin transmembrane helix small protein [Arenimonas fontis]